MQRPEGVLLSEIVEALGVQPHSAQAQISVLTRKHSLKATCVAGRYTLAPSTAKPEADVRA